MPIPADPPKRDEPPSIGGGDEPDDELSADELGDLFGAEMPIDGEDVFDTEEATDLDTGADTDELSDDLDDDGVTLDVGSDAEDLLPVDEGSDRPDDDASDNDFTFDGALPEGGELGRGEDTEGPDSLLTDLHVPALTPLDPEDDVEGVFEGESLSASWASGDEPRPPRAAVGLVELTALTLEACTALAVAEGVVVAASTDLFWFAAGSLTPLRLEAGSSRIRSLALTKTGWDYAVCATTNGRLLRRGRLAAASEELRGLRDMLTPTSTGPELFELCQPGAAFPHTLLVRSARGILLRSDDDALTFRRVTERRVRAVSPQGAPAVALTTDARLLFSDDGGGTFLTRELPASVRELAHGDAPFVAAQGKVMALAEPSLGVAVSADAGQSFTRVSGSFGVSAVCASDAPGTPLVWAALYDDVDRTYVARIDATSGQAETVAVIEPATADTDTDESGELARVARIEWDAVHVRLWLAGSFGVKAFEPAAS
jgi:hypothetical protein